MFCDLQQVFCVLCCESGLVGKNRIIAMNPQHDIVMSILETPFSRRAEQEKQEILKIKPTSKIGLLCADNRLGKQYCRSFKTSWFETYKWLCASSYKSSLFCWPCLLIGKTKNVWRSTGFCDLKNLFKGPYSEFCRVKTYREKCIKRCRCFEFTFY